MMYFTLDLIRQSQSDDDTVANPALAELDRRAEAYRAFYKANRSRFPARARRLHRTLSLHDAKVVYLCKKGSPYFALVLQQPARDRGRKPGGLLTLKYRPALGPHGGVTIRVPEEPLGGGDWVRTDELNLGSQEGTFIHNIMLANGVEIEVRFTAFSYSLLEISETKKPDSLELTWEGAAT